jgi:hypothetical protein
MKSVLSITCLILCLLALATGAIAQEQLNFSSLPLSGSPWPMPNGYGQLNWGNFFYVNPYGWPGAGPGYQLGPQGQDVAFIGGEFCRLSGGNTCFGTLSGAFQLLSANVAGGYGPAAITATAYNNGVYVGSANFFVGTQMETITFPLSWGVVTEVTLQVTGQTNDLVVYSLSVYTIINDPPPPQKE